MGTLSDLWLFFIHHRRYLIQNPGETELEINVTAEMLQKLSETMDRWRQALIDSEGTGEPDLE